MRHIVRSVFTAAFVFAVTACLGEEVTASTDAAAPWRNPDLPIGERVKDLVDRMTLEEKARQLVNSAPPISRLGLPGYDYWNECLHGVARAGTATVFPQAIGMAATWDVPLFHEIGDVIATEGRAKHNDYVARYDGNSARYWGLTYWTPNINIFRDPRWGRGQETYGEDPFLTSRLAVSFIHGLQGDDPKYLKAMGCAKHFAVHSGPEPIRHEFDVMPPERDFYETYLPQFEAAVREGHVGAVMGAYNSVYGEPACSNPMLLTATLRQNWGFDGHVVSDCSAIRDIYQGHETVEKVEEASARAIKAGCDLCCGADYNALANAVTNGLVTEKEINVALGRVLEARFRLGLFDPAERVPFAKISLDQNDTPEHAALALRTARESIVLLKNDGLLPLDRSKIKRIAVVGTNAASVAMLLGNYNGNPSKPVTILEGIKEAAGSGIEMVYESGCPLATRKGKPAPAHDAFAKSVAAAKSADVVVYVGGLNSTLEREEKYIPYEGFDGGDRTRIELPPVQEELIRALQATGKPVVFINCSGSAMAMPWEAKKLPAILQAWYPGQSGGRAVAEILFGEVNPSGRLPVTFYRSTADLPEFVDYSMANRTYRYFRGKPLFAFGHGLSYTKFKYEAARLDHEEVKSAETVRVILNVSNTGSRDGAEVVQVYYRHVKSAVPQARQALCGFRRVSVPHGQSVPVEIEIPVNGFRYWDTGSKQYIVEPGKYELLVGAASDDIRVKLPLKVSDGGK